MPRKPEQQLDLFAAEQESSIHPLAALAENLPARLYMGTSSWTFEGWQGLVYHRKYSKQGFLRDSLEEYARHPLFKTVGIDSTYYTPPREDLLLRYASQLPEGFLAVSKVWERLTIRTFPEHARYGAEAGKLNPHFMDATLFKDLVFSTYAACFQKHAGPFVFEFPPMRPQDRLETDEWLHTLQNFLGQLPPGPRYAVEIRNREYLTPDYLSILKQHGVAHVLNQWSFMPSVGTQAKISGIFTAPFVVVRLLMRPGTRYEHRLEQMAPFDKIVDPDPTLRSDVARLALQATSANKDIFVLVNNKAEGSAPLTIQSIAETILQEKKA